MATITYISSLLYNKFNEHNNNISHNTEKVIYFLLCDRKRRKPAFEDETDCIIRSRSESADPPKKRCDTRPYQSYRMEMLSNGSPIAPRRFPYGYAQFSLFSNTNNNFIIFSTALTVTRPQKFTLTVHHIARSAAGQQTEAADQVDQAPANSCLVVLVLRITFFFRQ